MGLATASPEPSARVGRLGGKASGAGRSARGEPAVLVSTEKCTLRDVCASLERRPALGARPCLTTSGGV